MFDHAHHAVGRGGVRGGRACMFVVWGECLVVVWCARAGWCHGVHLVVRFFSVGFGCLDLSVGCEEVVW